MKVPFYYEDQRHQASVVQNVDSVIHWMHIYPVDNIPQLVSLIVIHWIAISLVDI